MKGLKKTVFIKSKFVILVKEDKENCLEKKINYTASKQKS